MTRRSKVKIYTTLYSVLSLFDQKYSKIRELLLEFQIAVFYFSAECSVFSVTRSFTNHFFNISDYCQCWKKFDIFVDFILWI